ncbi:MAG: CpaF family protein [Actinomycetota bacterium]
MNAHDLVLRQPELADLDPAARRLALRELFAIDAPHEAGRLAAEASDLIDGYGPLTELMRDPGVTDVLVNAFDDVWVEERGHLRPAAVTFGDAGALGAFIRRITAIGGARVDASSPMADARLPDGARLHVVLPPLAGDGPLVSIRKFPPCPFDLDELMSFGLVTAAQADTLRDAVRERCTIAVGGATGTGKTTLVNALLGLIPATERVVLIEETRELRPRCRHVVSLVARPANIEGRGAVDLVDLFRTSLRMRPDRIIVGEVRGPEALVALDAMSTGHDGSMVTVHARTAADTVERFVSLAMQGDGGDAASLHDRFRRAFDLIVHLERRDGKRIVADIASP